MTQYKDQIERLASQITSGEDFIPLLSDIVKQRDQNVIKPLLLMMDFPEDFAHEMYAVAHAVEGFTVPIYVRELLSSIPGMAEVAPRFLRFLLLRIFRSDEYCIALKDTIADASPKAKQVVLAILNEVTDDSLESESFRLNCASMLTLLPR